MKECIFTVTESIIHQLFLKAYSVKSPGLFNGKIGIAISMFDYAQRTNNTLFSDFGDELIDGILDDVEYKTGFDFATGLSGIAWGIEYIVQHGYVECDTNQVCFDIDKRIEKVSLHRLNDLSLETGLEGILHYVLMRIKGSLSQNNPIPFSSDFLNEISLFLCKKKLIKKPSSLAILANQFNDFQIDKKSIFYQPNICFFIEKEIFVEDIKTAKLGLRKGLAGWLYSQELINL